MHRSTDDACEDIAAATTEAIEATRTVAATVVTNDEARALNDRIRVQRLTRGEVEDTTTTTGKDGLPIGVGDVIATRKNDSTLRVANRQTWAVHSISSDGTVWQLTTPAVEAPAVRCPPRLVRERARASRVRRNRVRRPRHHHH